MPTPGEEIPIHRVPSGLPGPGGTGFSPFAHGEFGGYHHGFFHLTMIWKRPSGVGYTIWPVATPNCFTSRARSYSESWFEARLITTTDENAFVSTCGFSTFARSGIESRLFDASCVAIAFTAYFTSSCLPNCAGDTTGLKLRRKSRASTGFLLKRSASRCTNAVICGRLTFTGSATAAFGAATCARASARSTEAVAPRRSGVTVIVVEPNVRTTGAVNACWTSSSASVGASPPTRTPPTRTPAGRTSGAVVVVVVVVAVASVGVVPVPAGGLSASASAAKRPARAQVTSVVNTRPERFTSAKVGRRSADRL